MPTYEYKCCDCGCRFERWQSIKDDPIKVCSECGGETRRVLFPVGVIFKGSGFYITDNRKADGGEEKAASSSSPSTSSSSNGDKGKEVEAKTESAKAEASKASSS